MAGSFSRGRFNRRSLLRVALAAPVLTACDARRLYGIPTPTPTGTSKQSVLLWHGDAVLGDGVLAREVLPRLARELPGIEVKPLAHGDPEELLRRVRNAAAGGVGPDVLQLPGEWVPEAVAGKLVQPLPGEMAGVLDPAGWTPNLVESGRWQGSAYGVPAAPWLRQPYDNDELLRNAGLIDAGRTTPPTTWAEYADVSKRVAAPDDRWGSMLPTNRADEVLFQHVVQHAHLAGGDLPRREGTKVAIDTPPMREALQFLLDLAQKNGGLPLDRPPYRLAETGKVGLWWSTSTWLGDQTAIGNTLRVGAAAVPRSRRGGALIRARHWCLGAYAGARGAAVAILTRLADDELSHRYCAAMSLPPARRANWGRPAYAAPKTPSAGNVWRATLEQLGQSENLPLMGFPGYRTATARLAGEFLLVLTGKKPIATALSEGEAGVAELLQKSDEESKS